MVQGKLMKVAVVAASVLGTTLVLPSWAQKRTTPLSKLNEEDSQWYEATTKTRAWVALEDGYRILEVKETHSVDDDEVRVQNSTESETNNKGTATTMTPTVEENDDDFDNHTQTVVPTSAPTIEIDIVHIYRSGAYEISFTANVDCEEILNTTWFTGTCCSLTEEVEHETCKLSVNNGICKTSGPYWSLELVSTASENGCPVSEFQVPIAILDTELPVTMSPSVSPTQVVKVRNGTWAPTLVSGSLGLLEQPKFCQDQGFVLSAACRNDTVQGGIWYIVTGTEGDAMLQLEWDCNATTTSLGEVPIHILSGNDCSELDCVVSGVLDTSVCDIPEPARRLRPRASSVPNTSSTIVFQTENYVSYFVLLETEESMSDIPLLLSDITEDTISSQPSETPPPTPMSTSTAMPTILVVLPTEPPSMPPMGRNNPTSTPSTNAPSMAPTTVATKQSSLSNERKWFGIGIMLFSLLVVVFC